MHRRFGRADDKQFGPWRWCIVGAYRARGHARVNVDLSLTLSSLGSRHSTPPLLCTLSAAALLAVHAPVWAWGFGKAQASVVLGAPLDFSVGLRLDAGESLPDCVSAEVTVGEIPVPRSAVSSALDALGGVPAIRVRTLVAVEEPLVMVQISAGCTSRMTRRFTLFADPPGHLAGPAVANAEALQGAAAAGQAPGRGVLPATPAAQAAALAVRPSAAATAALARGPDAPAASGATPTLGGTGSAARAAGRSGAGGAVRSARTPRPRLQLDAPVLMTGTGVAGGALQAAQDAALSARAAASAAQLQAVEMRKSIEALRQEAQANREALVRLTQALQEAHGTAEQIRWLWGGLAALGSLSLVLFLRSRRLQRGGGPTVWWSTASAAPESGPGASASTEALPVQAPAVTLPTTEPKTDLFTDASVALDAPMQTHHGRASAPAVQPPSYLQPLPSEEDRTADDSRLVEPQQAANAEAIDLQATSGTVSIDGLLDLEHQVEFYTLLGQRESALNLLLDHVVHTAGPYLLPHLQLLELLRQSSDESGYEAERVRLHQRFALTWPAWNQPNVSYRQLEDVPELLLEIQQVWPDPARALVLLERLLRTSDIQAALHPAVHSDLLLLFSLSRDLREQPMSGGGQAVDLLLPLQDSAFEDMSDPAVQPDDAAAARARTAASAASTDSNVELVMHLDLDLDLDLQVPEQTAPPRHRPFDDERQSAASQPEPAAFFDSIPLPLARGPSLSKTPLTAPVAPAPASIDLPLDMMDDSAPSAFVPVQAHGSAVLARDMTLTFDEPAVPGGAAHSARTSAGPARETTEGVSAVSALVLEVPEIDLPPIVAVVDTLERDVPVLEFSQPDRPASLVKDVAAPVALPDLDLSLDRWQEKSTLLPAGPDRDLGGIGADSPNPPARRRARKRR